MTFYIIVGGIWRGCKSIKNYKRSGIYLVVDTPSSRGCTRKTSVTSASPALTAERRTTPTLTEIHYWRKTTHPPVWLASSVWRLERKEAAIVSSSVSTSTNIVYTSDGGACNTKERDGRKIMKQ